MIAKMHPESVCLKVSFIVLLLSWILFPLVWFFTQLQKILSGNYEEKKVIDENELGVLLDTMEEEGEIEDEGVCLCLRSLF